MVEEAAVRQHAQLAALTSVPDGEEVAGSAFWRLPAATLIHRLRSDTTGLTSERAAELLERDGPNEVGTSSRLSVWRLLARQFVSPIEAILIGATVLSGALGDWTDAGIILGILVLSGLLGFAQEHRAGTAMASLLSSVEVTASVSRDGVTGAVPIREIVVGDVVTVAAGDLIPGDCLVVESTGLSVDESALTGETFPVEKQPGIAAADARIPDRTNAAFFGTHVAGGRGILLVARTGKATEIAEIAGRLAARAPQTGFEKGMTAFGLLLTRIMVVFVVAIFIINLLGQRPLIDSALFSLALAVGLTPQLLPAIVGLSLAQGARLMASKRVIVRRLDAIEDFGSMDILCSDKTGTMTEGEIQLSAATTLDGRPDAGIAELASLNSGLQSGWKNPIDEAVMAAHPLPIGAVALDELPYDFLRKRLSILTHRPESADSIMITKGALDAVLEVCSTAQTAGGVVALEEVGADLQRRFTELSEAGFRVLGVATRRLPDATSLRPADESEMTLVGLLSFADPVKSDAAGVIADLAASGVSVRMVTGDNHLVAAHIAQQVGLDSAVVFTGRDVDRFDAAALALAVPNVHVFSELNPVQKERVVTAFRSAGSVVGYLGDGINDSPPLRAADVGISVDTAVAVAKQAAAIVLLDKDLRVILDGVRQGRRTFANTMKYIFLTTSANFGNMLSMAVASVALPFLPLLAGQILLINLLTDLPATTMATDSVDDRQLRRPQAWDVRLIRNYMFVFGALSSVFDLTTFAVLRWGFAAEAPEFRSAWFLGSILTEVGVLFVLRTRGPSWRSTPSRWLLLSSALVAVVAIALPFSPIAPVLELVAIPLPLLALILLITAGYLVATELLKRVFWRRTPSAATDGTNASTGASALPAQWDHRAVARTDDGKTP